MESVYHSRCFRCVTCGEVFPPDDEVCYDGDDFFCQTCNTRNANYQSDISSSTLYSSNQTSPIDNKLDETYDINPNACVGCKNEIKNGQALIALDKQWHLWCFTCHKCGCLLVGDYMGRDGHPYCEKDYHADFGVTCDNCGDFITGKVLQAGEKHYHPKCSTCVMCGQIFEEGEEMFLQGSQIWHPKCSDKTLQEIENKIAGIIFTDDDSDDYLSDSTLPATENYDASRSYNDLSDVGNVEEDYIIPVAKEDTILQRDSRSYNDFLPPFTNIEEDEIIPIVKVDSELQFSGNPDLLSKLYNQDEVTTENMLTDIDQDEQLNSPETFRNDFYNYLTEADHASRTYQSTPTLPVAIPNGFRCSNPPLEVALCISPLSDGDVPPPKPPPPTRTSSKQWLQKYISIVYNTQKVRKTSFNKVMSQTADDSSTCTDSETFTSTVNTSNSTDGLNIPTDKITPPTKGSAYNKLKKRKSNDGSKVVKDFDFKFTSSFA